MVSVTIRVNASTRQSRLVRNHADDILRSLRTILRDRMVLGLVHGPQLLDAAVILDNTRQYGPPQVHYFHDASPRLYRWLVGGLPLEVVPASKL